MTNSTRSPYLNSSAIGREAFNKKKWQKFFLTDILEIKSGVVLKKEDITPGKIPFVSASAVNNAVSNFVSNINGSMDKNLLTVNFNGSVGETFYHPYACLVSGDVKRLHLKHHGGNIFIYLFIATLIKKQKDKYSYGYKFSDTRMKRQVILVPVTDSGSPDYEYMEQYVKNICAKKYKEYMEYKLGTPGET